MSATWLILLPALGAVFVLFVPRGRESSLKAVALAMSLITLAVAIGFAARFRPFDSFQFAEQVPWIPEWGISYHVGLDGVSLFLVLLTAFLTPLALLASWRAIAQQVKAFYALLLILEAGVIGAFSSLDLVLFYLFWEVMLIPMYFVIGIWGSKRRIYAAIKFLLFTLTGSLAMLVGILWCYRSLPDGVRSFDLLVWQEHLRLDPGTQMWVLGTFALAFAVKVPLFPLHTWLPEAHVEAPTAGSVILAGVLLKMGVYGFLRFAFPLFPEATVAFREPLMVLSAIGVVYGSLMCLAQSDMKKLIAYSSIAHLGAVMLGTMSFTVAGTLGGVFQMLSHGLSTGALFLLVGMLYERRHTRRLADFGGLARPMPHLGVCFVIISLGAIGLPGLSGFIGEFMITVGAFHRHWAWGTVAALGVVLSTVYMLGLVEKILFGTVRHAENRELADLGVREKAVLWPVVALVVLLGIFPSVILGRVEPSVRAILRGLDGETSVGACSAGKGAGTMHEFVETSTK